MSNFLSGPSAQEPWIETCVVECLQTTSTSTSTSATTAGSLISPPSSLLGQCVVAQVIDITYQEEKDLHHYNYHRVQQRQDNNGVWWLRVSDGRHHISLLMVKAAEHAFVQDHIVGAKGCLIRIKNWNVLTQQQALQQRQMQSCQQQQKQQEEYLVDDLAARINRNGTITSSQHQQPAPRQRDYLCLFVQGKVDFMGGHGLLTIKNPQDIQTSTKVKQWLLFYQHDWNRIQSQLLAKQKQQQVISTARQGHASSLPETRYPPTILTSTSARRKDPPESPTIGGTANAATCSFAAPPPPPPTMGDVHNVLSKRQLLQAISDQVALVKQTWTHQRQRHDKEDPTARPPQRRQEQQQYQHQHHQQVQEGWATPPQAATDSDVNPISMNDSNLHANNATTNDSDDNSIYQPLCSEHQSPSNGNRPTTMTSRKVSDPPASENPELVMMMLASHELVEPNEDEEHGAEDDDDDHEEDEDMGIDAMLVSQPPETIMEENRSNGEESVMEQEQLESQQLLETQEERSPALTFVEEERRPALTFGGRKRQRKQFVSCEEQPSPSDTTPASVVEKQTRRRTHMNEDEEHAGSNRLGADNSLETPSPRFLQATVVAAMTTTTATMTDDSTGSRALDFTSAFHGTQLLDTQPGESCSMTSSPRSATIEDAEVATSQQDTPGTAVLYTQPIALQDANDKDIENAYEEAERTSPNVIRTPKQVSIDETTPAPPQLMVTLPLLLESRHPSPVPDTPPQAVVVPPPCPPSPLSPQEQQQQITGGDSVASSLSSYSPKPHNASAQIMVGTTVEPPPCPPSPLSPHEQQQQKTGGDSVANSLSSNSPKPHDALTGEEGNKTTSDLSDAHDELQLQWANHPNSLIEKTFREFGQQVAKQTIQHPPLPSKLTWQPAGRTLRDFLYANSTE
ncbi:hypothetical protein ACA910_015081 [Epithemia clementina (nom. ined.)]